MGEKIQIRSLPFARFASLPFARFASLPFARFASLPFARFASLTVLSHCVPSLLAHCRFCALIIRPSRAFITRSFLLFGGLSYFFGNCCSLAHEIIEFELKAKRTETETETIVSAVSATNEANGSELMNVHLQTLIRSSRTQDLAPIISKVSNSRLRKRLTQSAKIDVGEGPTESENDAYFLHDWNASEIRRRFPSVIPVRGPSAITPTNRHLYIDCFRYLPAPTKLAVWNLVIFRPLLRCKIESLMGPCETIITDNMLDLRLVEMAPRLAIEPYLNLYALTRLDTGPITVGLLNNPYLAFAPSELYGEQWRAIIGDFCPTQSLASHRDFHEVERRMIDGFLASFMLYECN